MWGAGKEGVLRPVTEVVAQRQGGKWKLKSEKQAGDSIQGSGKNRELLAVIRYHGLVNRRQQLLAAHTNFSTFTLKVSGPPGTALCAERRGPAVAEASEDTGRWPDSWPSSGSVTQSCPTLHDPRGL